MSGSASSDWLQFYQHSDQPPSKAEVGWTGEPATTITAANITSTTSPPQTGRVSKPNPRRRSRASRRTPTTLLSTDTTNFRAMVQQFTGGGQTGQTAPPAFISTNDSTNQFLGAYNNNSANLNFGLGPTSSMVVAPPPPPPAGPYSVQFRQPKDGGGGVDQHEQYYVPSSGNNTHAQHQAFLRTLQNYASAGPPRESLTDVDLTTQGEDDNYMF